MRFFHFSLTALVYETRSSLNANIAGTLAGHDHFTSLNDWDSYGDQQRLSRQAMELSVQRTALQTMDCAVSGRCLRQWMVLENVACWHKDACPPRQDMAAVEHFALAGTTAVMKRRQTVITLNFVASCILGACWCVSVGWVGPALSYCVSRSASDRRSCSALDLRRFVGLKFGTVCPDHTVCPSLISSYDHLCDNRAAQQNGGCVA